MLSGRPAAKSILATDIGECKKRNADSDSDSRNILKSKRY